MEPIMLVKSPIPEEDHPFQSISSPLTFNTSGDASMQYRSSTSSGSCGDTRMLQMQTNVTFGQKDSSAISFFVPSQVHKSCVSMVETPICFYDQKPTPSPIGCAPFEFSLNATFPKSKCQQIDPFTLPQEPMSLSNNSNNHEDQSEIQFPYCNPLNSYIVDMATQTVLEVLHCILNAFNGDLDFTTNMTECRIDGLVFVSHQAIYFMLYVHEGTADEQSENKSTVEYRRSSGDPMASSSFWHYIQRQLQQKFGCKDGGPPDSMEVEHDNVIEIGFDDLEFVPDSEMHVDALYEIDSDIEVETEIGNKVYLDQITESIQLNEVYLVEELRALYQQMTSAGETLCGDMLHHEAFLDAILGQALLHKDICISRFAVLILQQISKVHGGCSHLVGDSADFHSKQLFENINKLLCCHSKAFIKKQAIRFLDQLTITPSWNIPEIDKNQLMWRMKQYTKEYVGDEDIQRAIERVNRKLSGNGH